jgi:DnaK suppressor protein
MNQVKLKRFKALLKDQLASLSDNTTDTREHMEVDPQPFADPNDRAAHESDRNFDLRLRDRDRKLILKIHEALRRIDEGTFGVCEDGGNAIEDTRLQARPVTSQCFECKDDQERRERRERNLVPEPALTPARSSKR